VRFSRDGLSSQLFPHRDWRANRWASDIVNSPRSAKKALPPLTPISRAANIASVQIEAGANFRCLQLSSARASRLVVSDTVDASTFISASFRSFAINLPAPLPSCAFCSDALLHGPAQCSVRGTIGTLTPARVHFTGRSPRLSRLTFPSFRLQPRDAPRYRFVHHFTVPGVARLRLGIASSPQHPAESSSSSYGPTVRLRLLPTLLRSNAVTFSFGNMALPGTDFHRADKTPPRAYSPPAEPGAYLYELGSTPSVPSCSAM
jgi:hypothetical protein